MPVTIQHFRRKSFFFQGDRRDGSVIFSLYATLVMVGIIGVMAVNLMKGPVRAMSDVTKRTIAENQLIAAGKLALVQAAHIVGDCDGDGLIEPLTMQAPLGMPHPANGGLLPPNTGAALQDPWGNHFGYCAWDHGALVHDITCGPTAGRLQGGENEGGVVIAVISSGPDRIFQTRCHDYGAGNVLERASGGDDIVLSYTYAEAKTMAGALWNLRSNDSSTAQIAKNIAVTDEDGADLLRFETETGQLSLAAGGMGVLPSIRTDYIQNLTANAPIEFLGSIKAGEAVMMTNDSHAVAAVVTASGAAGIGLKASGTGKAIEAAGLLDMTAHRIIGLATPVDEHDGATKEYVDEAARKGGRFSCEAFTANLCAGGAAVNLDKRSLGHCKKACEAAGVQCCLASYPLLGNNPNAELAGCTGYNGNSQPVGTRLLTAVLGTLASYCYRTY